MSNDNKPAAAQEAVWELAKKVRTELDRASCPDAFMRLAVEAVMEHAAAPVAAAPVGMTRDDAEQAISRIMGEYGFSMPSRAYAELVDELMSTPAAPVLDPGLYDWLKARELVPDGHAGQIDMAEVVEALNEHERQLLAGTPAAPGIDLQQFRVSLAYAADVLLRVGNINDSKVAARLETLLALIDASPNGGSTDAEPKIWGTQKPGSMPKLFGARHIAELNWYPGEGYDLVCMQVIERVQPTSHGAGVSDE